MFFSIAFVLAVCLVALGRAARSPLGLHFNKRAGDLPTLTLPYGTYKAKSYNPNGDLYVFKNIRFAAPPTGSLRWAKPQPPGQQSGVQDGSYGPVCVQTSSSGPTGGIAATSFVEQSEDCLFLDIYVPAKAIKNPSSKLPVISWFYGGAFLYGGKDSLEPLLPFYDGTGLIQESSGNVIFVASNYRVGAYGFLAGTTMEKQGLPNAGLYDQHAALQWIQDYIGLLGGDKTQVSAWGESAGAGSILHQLVSFGGTQHPLFSKAIMQSPAFALLFDRKGRLEQTFQNFTGLAGCSGQGVACLRAASADALKTANTQLSQNAVQGTFSVGPAADGNLIRQLPSLEFATGNYYKGVTSLILSHVSDEPDIFVPSNVQTDAQFNALIDASYPPYAAPVKAAIEAHYPPVMSGIVHNYTTEHDRLKGYLGDGSFYCNVRYLSDAYKGKNYNLQYSVTPGLHAVDLLPTFYNLNLDLTTLANVTAIPLIPGFGSFAQVYQSYLVSHARSGNPNTYKKFSSIPPAITWPKPGNSGDALTGVLDATDLGFTLITDQLTKKSTCSFWVQVAAAVTDLGGYAPPGSVVPTTLVPVGNDPSTNYAS